MGFSWWESRKGKSALPKESEHRSEAGWSVLLHLPPSDPIFSSPLLCAGPCACFWEKNIFQFQFFLIVSFYHQILPNLTSRKDRSFHTNFFGATQSEGGVSLRKWEKLLTWLFLINFRFLVVFFCFNFTMAAQCLVLSSSRGTASVRLRRQLQHWYSCFHVSAVSFATRNDKSSFKYHLK